MDVQILAPRGQQDCAISGVELDGVGAFAHQDGPRLTLDDHAPTILGRKAHPGDPQFRIGRARGRHQGIQLGHHWWESLDYANRQTSLTTDQAQLSSDGAYYFVIANTDPGVPNWLDTEGFSRGVILMRFDGLAPPEIPEEQHPRTKLVKSADVRAHLPADEPVVTAEQRASQLAQRRQHAQRRENF